MKYILPTLAALALAGCGETESAEEVREETATVAPVPERIAEASPTPFDDGTLGSDEVAQGQWVAKTERGTAMALFGPPQSEAAFSVRCEGDSLVFARSALLPAGEAAMRLMADGQTRRLAARTQEDPLPQVTASLPSSEPFAGTLARTTEPIAVGVGDGGQAFRMPSDPILRGVIADCIAG